MTSARFVPRRACHVYQAVTCQSEVCSSPRSCRVLECNALADYKSHTSHKWPIHPRLPTIHRLTASLLAASPHAASTRRASAARRAATAASSRSSAAARAAAAAVTAADQRCSERRSSRREAKPPACSRTTRLAASLQG